MLVGVRATQPTYANRSGYKKPATWSQEVFHCMFGPSGPNHATTAIDTSPINAPLTFHGSAEISTTPGSIPITNPTVPAWTSALSCPTDGAYVECPPNAAYPAIGKGDFTIEFFFAQNRQTNPNGPIQWLGVWNGPLQADQCWRFVTDRERWHFQWWENGIVHEWAILATPGGGNNNSWVKPIIERYLGIYLFWMQYNDTMINLPGLSVTGYFDTPANPVPLRMGGIPAAGGVQALASLGYMRDVRITAAAQYRGQTPPLQMAPSGFIMPPIIIDTDSIYGPRVGQLLVSTVVDQDQFYAPVIKQDAVLRPSRVVDADTFYAVGQPPLWDNTIGQGYDSCCQGPVGPNVRDETIGPPYPVFEDETITSGTGSTATLSLPATRNTGDVLWALVQYDTPLARSLISMSNGTSTGGGGAAADAGSWYWNPSDLFCQTRNLTTNITSRAFYMVDGSEVAPTFTLPSSVNWVGRILRFSNVDQEFSFPFWDYSPWNSLGVDVIRSAEAVGVDPPFVPYSELYWDEAGNSAMFIKVLTTTSNEVLPDQYGYRTIAKHNTAAGSFLACVLNAPAQDNFDNWGSGAIRDTLAGTTNTDASLFTINTAFP